MCQKTLDLERINGKERTESKCRKDDDHDLRYGPGPPAEFRLVSMRRLLHWSGQQQHFLHWLQALGAQEMQWAEALDRGPWLQMYTVPGNCMPLGQQTTEVSPSRTWQAGDGSFLLLPRRHALSSRWLWTFNHNTCENHLEEVQGAAASSLFTPPLFQDTWPCVQLLCASAPYQCSIPVRLGHGQNQTSNIYRGMTGQWSDLQCQAARRCHHQVQWILAQLGIEDLDLILKERRLRWYGHGERSNGAVKTAFHVQVEGKRGPGRLKMTWEQLTERDCREYQPSL